MGIYSRMWHEKKQQQMGLLREAEMCHCYHWVMLMDLGKCETNGPMDSLMEMLSLGRQREIHCGMWPQRKKWMGYVTVWWRDWEIRCQ